MTSAPARPGYTIDSTLGCLLRSAMRAALFAGRGGRPTATVVSLANTDPTCRARGSLPDTLPAQTGAVLGSDADRWIAPSTDDTREGRGGVPRRDVVALEGEHDGVELDAELDVGVADVLGGRLCAAPAVEDGLEGFHVADEVVYDRGDVGVKLGCVKGGAGRDRIGAHGRGD